MRAKDQLYPVLQELVTSCARFKGSKDWEGQSKMVGWCVGVLLRLCWMHSLPGGRRLIALNGMKASEELTEEQARQVSAPLRDRAQCALLKCRFQLSFDIEHAYAEFFRSLSGKDGGT